MENITLGQIYQTLIFLGGLIGTILLIAVKFKNIVGKLIKDEIKPIIDYKTEFEEAIEDIKTNMNKNRLDSIKRDLVNLMGIAKQDMITEEQRKLAHELMDIYTKAGLNSYVHTEWDKLVKGGKI